MKRLVFALLLVVLALTMAVPSFAMEDADASVVVHESIVVHEDASEMVRKAGDGGSPMLQDLISLYALNKYAAWGMCCPP